jgi:hypothetical protein
MGSDTQRGSMAEFCKADQCISNFKIVRFIGVQFLNLTTIQRDIAINVYKYSYTVPVILVIFQ